MPILKSTPNSTTPLVDENGLPTRQFQLLMAALTEPGNITSYDLADGAVLTTKLANGSVSTDKLPDNVITATKISDNSITTSKILANAITSNLIAAGAIVTDKIYANSIVTQHISIGAVTTPNLAINSVSYAGGQSSNSSSATINLVPVENSIVCILGTYDGTAAVSSGTITISVNGTPIDSGTIPGIYFTSMGLSPGTNPVYGGAYYGDTSNHTQIYSYAPVTTVAVYPRTIQTNYTVQNTDTALAITCSTNVGGPVSVLAWELSR